MHFKSFISLICLLVCANLGSAEKPNIVLILADDLGYGDVQCFNRAHGLIKTPNVDRLAKQGMMFTDAHSASSVCTPTRYGILTGRYCWRTKLQKGVVQGFAPCLIEEARPTLASFLKAQGYRTGIIGKWHLNMRFLDPKTETELQGRPYKHIAPLGAVTPDGPTSRGFDRFFGIHHARSMKAIIEQNVVTEHDDVVNFLPRIGKESLRFIGHRRSSKQPFFLYVPLGSPHTPIVPSTRWHDKSGLGKYADFVMQTDHVIGQILRAIEELDSNTLVILSSDNGCSRAAGIKELAKLGHKVSADLRGSKADIWEGGHRVPFVARWPGKIEPGSKCGQLICLNDLFATVAEILKVPVPKQSCEDSVSFLPAFSNQMIVAKRKGIVHHSASGHFAYRTGRRKLILARGSGGWTSPRENQVDSSMPEGQLYDLSLDLGERSNQYLNQPEIVEQLLAQLKEDVFSGRSTPGPKSANDVGMVELWKSGRSQLR